MYNCVNIACPTCGKVNLMPPTVPYCGPECDPTWDKAQSRMVYVPTPGRVLRRDQPKD